MKRWIRCITLTICLCTLFPGVSAQTQSYPSKPIRIITGEASGGADLAARIVGPGMSPVLGQPMVVDNRASALTAGIVANAPADGYTVLIIGGTFIIDPLLRKTNYHPVTSFEPITSISKSPTVLVVVPSSPIKSVKDLIAAAKAKPGVLNYGSSGAGTTIHLTVELFKSMAGVNIVDVAYKGTSPAITALLAGEVQLMFAPANAAIPLVKSGKLAALAVTSAQPSVLLPGVPTVAASGVPGYEAVSTIGLLAPAKTPIVIVDRLNHEARTVLAQAEVKERFFNTGVEVATSTPGQYRSALKDEFARMEKVIKDAHIHID